MYRKVDAAAPSPIGFRRNQFKSPIASPKTSWSLSVGTALCITEPLRVLTIRQPRSGSVGDVKLHTVSFFSLTSSRCAIGKADNCNDNRFFRLLICFSVDRLVSNSPVWLMHLLGIQ